MANKRASKKTIVAALPAPVSTGIPEKISSLPVPENPQHPVVQYMQDKLGADFQLSPNYGLRGLPDIPKNRGNADLFNAVANLPVEQGGLVGSNLEARPELFLGNDRPGQMVIAPSGRLYNNGVDMNGSTGLTYLENPPRVYIDPTQPKGDWAGASKNKVNPFQTIVHEMNHANNIVAGSKPRPAVYHSAYAPQPITAASANFDAQNRGDVKRFTQDAYDLGWPSTVDPKSNYMHRNFSETMATAAGLEAVQPRGKLPWDSESGAKLFNTPERKGAYVDATRTGREPIASSSEGYDYGRFAQPRFKESYKDRVQQDHNSRGLGGYNALMNTRPINQVVADWFK